MDDEEMVRGLTTRMLERVGFDVLTAVDGREGLEMFTGHQKEIHLLDLTMPRMSGDEVYRAIQEIAPGTPVVLSSGFSESEALHRVGDEDWVDFIQKPYQPQELQEKILFLLQALGTPVG